ncbi:hypothetical protein AaE_011662 [Aphanomyces astaci]|uniref:Tc1-like transposase DDE domain-containing protein n=1 Tax=Aphanomyces astaci TaxID=112090 RepID=A0A6A4ZMV6_APHAT|nr:hypothetical protein AaE_011662 [Aphanomyces astaci]
MLELEIEVSKSTLHRELDKRVYTFKSVHYEPLQMNDPTFKEKRREYVQQLRDLLDKAKYLSGSTKRTSTCLRVALRPGKNLHVIGAISTTNFFYCTHKRGAYKHADANQWIRGMLGSAMNHYGGLQDIVVIADNAPCHSRLENVFAEDEFRPATLLRLAPYSPMMNPIENLWSQFKAHVKTLLRERLAAFMGPPPDGSTREEFRMQYLEHTADEAMNQTD